jgi:hypothetical protein
MLKINDAKFGLSVVAMNPVIRYNSGVGRPPVE